jgi:hypothetical protein
MRRTILAAAAVSAAVIGLPGTALAAGATYVTPADIAPACSADMTVDFCEFEGGGGSVEIGQGTPDEASGTDHLLMATPGGADKAYVFGYEFAGQRLADIETLRYRSLVTTVNPKEPRQAPALNIQIDPDGPAKAGGFATLVWEPVYAEGESTAADVWLTRSPSSSDGGWWSTKNVPITTGVDGALGFPSFTAGWDDVQAALPDATVLGIGVNQGGGNQGLVSEVDLLQVNDTVYDFGLAPTRKDQCKSGGWADFEAPAFRNQGDCVSSVVSQSRNR